MDPVCRERDITPDRSDLGDQLTIKLRMPQRVVFVRHGESQANVVNRAIKNGSITDYPEGFDKIPDREIRLSDLGREQARITGPWLKQAYPNGFDIIYVSDHARAMETAALLCKAAGWDHVEIRIDPLLGERNWGRFASLDYERRKEIMENRKRDPLHNPMPDGETLLETRHRSREFLDRCVREFGDKTVLAISHGEFIEALWSEIAHLNTKSQIELFESEVGDIKNCQVIEFSSSNPSSGESVGKLRWVRSSCPQAGIYGDWLGIKRTVYTPDEILAEVEGYPTLELPKDGFK